MTREQALDRLIIVETQLRDLQHERSNLRKIVLAQIISNGPVQPVLNSISRKLPTGEAAKIIGKVISDSGPLRFGAIKAQTTLSENTIHTALTNLRQQGLINRIGEGRSDFIYEIAVKRDS